MHRRANGEQDVHNRTGQPASLLAFVVAFVVAFVGCTMEDISKMDYVMYALQQLAVRKATLSEVPVFARLCELPDLVVVHRQNDRRYVLVGNELRPLKLVIGTQPAAPGAA